MSELPDDPREREPHVTKAAVKPEADSVAEVCESEILELPTLMSAANAPGAWEETWDSAIARMPRSSAPAASEVVIEVEVSPYASTPTPTSMLLASDLDMPTFPDVLPPQMPAPAPVVNKAWEDPPPPPIVEAPPRRSVEPNGRPLQRRAPLARYGRVLSLSELSRRSNDPALALIRDPDGEFATAIRLLGTKLEEIMRTLGYRTYLLTSADPLAGKTTTACNLAFALAEDTHRRVALIEANFRNPRIGAIVGTPEEQGLLRLLDGRADVSETIAKVSDRNLVIFPSGGTHPNPAELLASARFKTLISEIAGTIDVAIIDAPAVAPFADANLLLPLLDGAILVVAEGRTAVTAVSSAGAQLGGSRVLGAVYNRIPKPVADRLNGELKRRMKPRSARSARSAR